MPRVMHELHEFISSCQEQRNELLNFSLLQKGMLDLKKSIFRKSEKIQNFEITSRIHKLVMYLSVLHIYLGLSMENIHEICQKLLIIIILDEKVVDLKQHNTKHTAFAQANQSLFV